MRELSKEITIGEDVYVLRKMDAFEGAYLIKFATSKLLPLLSTAQEAFGGMDDASKKNRGKKRSAEPDDDELMGGALKMLPVLLDAIDKDTLKDVMVSCLNYVDKRLPGGDQQVMRGKNFGIEGIEYDTGLCLVLALQCAIFNCGSFFAESGLDLSSVTKRLTSQPKQ